MNKKVLIYTLVLIISLCSCLNTTTAKAEDIAIKFTFDKTSYKIGEQITVQYKITGGSGSYKNIFYDCYSWDNGTLVTIITAVPLTESKGTIVFTPTVGQEASVYIIGSDSEGRSFYVSSDRVKLTGGATTDPISVKYKFDKSSYKLGQKITVQYTISGGSGSYKNIFYDCYSWDNGTLVTIITAVPLTESKGTIVFTPTVGQEASVYIIGSDSEGRSFYVSSDRVSLIAKTISKAKVSLIDNQVYTGKSIKPDVTVNLNNKILNEGTDYKLTYKNNKNIGTATITITAAGVYSGTLTTTFRIIPRPVTLSSLSASKSKLTIKWKKDKTITGYEIQYSLKKSFKKAKSITINNPKTVKKVIKKLKKGKTYYIRIRSYKKIKEEYYYSSWSEAKKIKIK